MASDHYETLRVVPDAEHAVIRAAYRALMRLYHPDATTLPDAQERVRDITAAYAVLSDPERRLAYDAQRRAADEPWMLSRIAADNEPRPAPAMRKAGIASVALAFALVITVALWTRPDAGTDMRTLTAPAPAAGQQASARQAALPDARVAEAEVEIAPPMPNPDVDVPVREAGSTVPVFAAPPLPESRRVIAKPEVALTAGTRARSATPNNSAVALASAGATADRAAAPAAARTGEARNADAAKLDQMAEGFLKQSMAHADWRKQQLLLSARTRSATAKSLCRSDDCVAKAYSRQMREISAIMEDRPLPDQ